MPSPWRGERQGNVRGKREKRCGLAAISRSIGIWKLEIKNPSRNVARYAGSSSQLTSSMRDESSSRAERLFSGQNRGARNARRSAKSSTGNVRVPKKEVGRITGRDSAGFAWNGTWKSSDNVQPRTDVARGVFPGRHVSLPKKRGSGNVCLWSR